MAPRAFNNSNNADESMVYWRNILQDETETWQLVNQIIKAERMYFESGEQAVGAAQCCPKSLELQTLVEDHATIATHAIAAWLEEIEPETDLQVGQTDDQCLSYIYQMLRQGKEQALCQKLIAAGKLEQFLWLIGSSVHFDNVVFETRSDCEGLVSDFDMANNLEKVQQSTQQSEENFHCGNRSNLLFIETCLDHIAQCQGRHTHADIFEGAILGVQAGHYQSVLRAVKHLGGKYKDMLWAHMRSASTQLRLKRQISAVIEGEEGPLNEYNSFYSQMMDASDCHQLAHKLHNCSPELVQSNNLNVEALLQAINQKYSENDFTWFERIQQQLIAITLKSASHRGINLWDNFIIGLPSQIAKPEQSRFAAHICIMLMLQNRLTEKAIPAYNQIVSDYVESIANTEMSITHKNEMLPFYTSFLLGRDQMCVTHARIMIGVNDDSHIGQISQHVRNTFTEQMVCQLTRAIPEVELYGAYGRSTEVLQKLYSQIDVQHVQFRNQLTEEEVKSIQSLKWMKLSHAKQENLVTVMGYYNEVARKFLLESRHQAAQYLLGIQLPQQLSPDQAQLLTSMPIDLILDDFSADRQLVAYLRERERILKLCQVIDNQQLLVGGSEETIDTMITDCWDLLKCTVIQNTFMLLDNQDVLRDPQIGGDRNRSESLKVLSQQYCHVVLAALYDALFQNKAYDFCNCLVTKVLAAQPLLSDFLVPAELMKLLGKQTDSALRSHNVMLETFQSLSGAGKNRTDHGQEFTGADFNY